MRGARNACEPGARRAALHVLHELRWRGYILLPREIERRQLDVVQPRQQIDVADDLDAIGVGIAVSVENHLSHPRDELGISAPERLREPALKRALHDGPDALLAHLPLAL